MFHRNVQLFIQLEQIILERLKCRHVHGHQRLGVLGQLRSQAAAQSTGECHLANKNKKNGSKCRGSLNLLEYHDFLLGWPIFRGQVLVLGSVGRWFLEIFVYSSHRKVGERIKFSLIFFKGVPTCEVSIYCGKWYVLFTSVWGSTPSVVCFCFSCVSPGIKPAEGFPLNI